MIEEKKVNFDDLWKIYVNDELYAILLPKDCKVIYDERS